MKDIYKRDKKFNPYDLEEVADFHQLTEGELRELALRTLSKSEAKRKPPTKGILIRREEKPKNNK